jgi:hypothetical protein
MGLRRNKRTSLTVMMKRSPFHQEDTWWHRMRNDVYGHLYPWKCAERRNLMRPRTKMVASDCVKVENGPNHQSYKYAIGECLNVYNHMELDAGTAHISN